MVSHSLFSGQKKFGPSVSDAFLIIPISRHFLSFLLFLYTFSLILDQKVPKIPQIFAQIFSKREGKNYGKIVKKNQPKKFCLKIYFFEWFTFLSTFFWKTHF